MKLSLVIPVANFRIRWRGTGFAIQTGSLGRENWPSSHRNPSFQEAIMAQSNDTLNRLLRGEISACETYQQALSKVASEEARDLQQIHDEHRDAANTLREHVHQHGGKPEQGSGAWGAFAKAVEGTAKVFGNAAAIKALKEGEEHGVKDYESALDEAKLPTDCKELIRSRLLPRTRAHVSVLDRLLSAK
jgi:uncharacterized protein (TIGR02284 family)